MGYPFFRSGLRIETEIITRSILDRHKLLVQQKPCPGTAGSAPRFERR
jgi:hypothetical protein